jgi:hypothetical protein
MPPSAPTRAILPVSSSLDHDWSGVDFQLVFRHDIVELLWGKDAFVDVDTGVHTAIRKIRRALR